MAHVFLAGPRLIQRAIDRTQCRLGSLQRKPGGQWAVMIQDEKRVMARLLRARQLAGGDR